MSSVPEVLAAERGRAGVCRHPPNDAHARRGGADGGVRARAAVLPLAVHASLHLIAVVLMTL